MRCVLITLAFVLLVVFIASNPSIAQVTESPQYDTGRVIALTASSGVYEVQVLTTGTNFTVAVPKDLWEQLDIGDTIIRDADGVHLLRKGPEPDEE